MKRSGIKVLVVVLLLVNSLSMFICEFHWGRGVNITFLRTEDRVDDDADITVTLMMQCQHCLLEKGGQSYRHTVNLSLP